MERDYYYHIYPSIWNKVKFDLYKGMILSYRGELPDYVKNFCKELSIELIPFDDMAKYNLEERFFEAPKTNGSEVIEGVEVFYVDYDAMYSESWDTIEDCKICYVECTKDNVCTTLYKIGEFKKHTAQKIWEKLGYSIVPLIWEENIPFFKEEQIKLIENIKEDICIGKLEEFEKYETRISIFPNVVDAITKTKYIHIMSSSGRAIIPVYRRFFLNKALKEKYGDDLATDNFLGLNISDLCIISHPTSYIPASKYMIYDRTDNWSHSDDKEEIEDLALKKASMIICSSKWLYNDTKSWLEKNRSSDNVPIVYIPNGNQIFSYPTNVEKFEKKTAIYIGNQLSKIDLQLLFLICQIYTDWNFMLYATDSTQLKTIPDNLTVHEMIDMKDLYPVLCKCHIGLCLLKDDEWCKGMLPNKTFSYFNAHIPVVYSGIPDINMEDYKGCAFNISDMITLDDILSKTDTSKFDEYTRSWDEVTSEIINTIEKFKTDKEV